jgi:nicotinamidase-related amidase
MHLERSWKGMEDMKINPRYLSFYYQDMEDYQNMEIDLKKTALCIIDYQKEFCDDHMGEALEIKKNGQWERWQYFRNRIHNTAIPNTQKLLFWARKEGMTVTFGRIACLSPDGEDRSPVQKREGWNNIFLYRGSEEAAMVDELKPLPEEMVFDKTTDSIMGSTSYAGVLRNMGITTVIVAGIVTDQCVACSVRDLADAGFQVICVEDACAAASQEGHDAELKIMNVIYCRVCRTEETLELLEKAAAAGGPVTV